MPCVKVFRDDLYAKIGRTFTDKEFATLCFQFGVELDDITSEKQMEQVARAVEVTSMDNIASHEIIFKIDIPANRYDLLCVEGIARAFKIFLGLAPNPDYKIVVPDEKNLIHMIQLTETASVRPFILCAVLRDVTFTQASYDSFIALQDKLHENIGRHRSLVAIGTHDLDRLTPPFYYKALPFSDIKFAPLGETTEYDVNGLFEHYKTDEMKQVSIRAHLRPFLKLTENSPVHPVIYDANNTVLSLPPIINGDHSKLTLNTRNVFIEMTGTDLTKLGITMDIVVSMFSEYCAQPFTVEAVSVDRSGAPSKLSPSLKSSVFPDVSVAYINNLVGINWTGDDMASQLGRMQMPAVYVAQSNTLTVTVPHTRPDILHRCDIAEDVAIVFGYDNIKKVLPPVMTVGGQVPLNHLSDLNREVVAQAGFTEVLTWVLCHRDDNFVNIGLPDDGQCVLLGHTKAKEFNAVRTNLIPGLLKVINSSLGQTQLPVRVFESGDVCMLDAKSETGARNERRLAALFCGRNSGVEEIHALVDRVLAQNNCAFIAGSGAEAKALLAGAADAPPSSATNLSGTIKKPYFLLSSANELFMDLRRADIYVAGRKVGHFGIVHPRVLKAYDISFPCSALELNLEFFL